MFGGIAGIGQTWYVDPVTDWTIFNPSKDTQKVYVSSRGGIAGTANSSSDTYDGLSPSWTSGTNGPKLTLASAHTVMLARGGKPDWLLLERGSTFTGGLAGTGGGSITSGRSNDEPTLLTSYGIGARPRIIKGTDLTTDVNYINTGGTQGLYFAISGIDFYGDQFDPASPSFGGATILGDTTAASNVITNVGTIPANVVVGMQVYGAGLNNFTIASIGANSITLTGGQNATYTGTQIPIQVATKNVNSSVNVVGNGTFIYIEDCTFSFASFVLAATNNPQLNLTIRRCVFNDGYAPKGGTGSNIFLAASYPYAGGNILIEKNFMVRGGWNSSVWAAGASVFTHNMYLHDQCVNMTVKQNVIADGSADACQFRDGGEFSNNLCLRQPVVMATHTVTRATSVRDNVCLNGSDLIRGYRTATADASSGTTITCDGLITSLNNGRVSNLSNPGSIKGVITAASATTGTLSGTGAAVSAGVRGDGVKIGDTLIFTNPRTQGIVASGSGPIYLASGPSAGDYPIGSTVFSFNPHPLPGWGLLAPLPSWVTVGMSVYAYNGNAGPQLGAFTGNSTTIASISIDRTSITTTDASIAIISTTANQGMLVFGLPGNTNLPAVRIGPNNILAHGKPFDVTSSGALTFDQLTDAVDATANYIYNWDNVNTTNNIQSSEIFGTNLKTQTLNVVNDTSFPQAFLEYYDATLRAAPFTGTIVANGSGGGTLTCPSNAVSIGDYLFDNTGGNAVPMYTKVVSGSGTTFTVATDYGPNHTMGTSFTTIGPISMLAGSIDHFLTQAVAAWNKDTFDSRYSTAVVNNFIRTQMGIATI